MLVNYSSLDNSNTTKASDRHYHNFPVWLYQVLVTLLPLHLLLSTSLFLTPNSNFLKRQLPGAANHIFSKLDVIKIKVFGWDRGLRSSSVSPPPHLSDLSHTLTPSKDDRSGIASEKKTPSISRRIKSLVEAPTSSGSVSGGRSRLRM
ncbi:uncharacterized protein LOC121757974 [Salvia splendens]|uniref:uncharacterized protein LOC121757974 n=1 Tax=Salvia splendens TaxID=180675 RepID=UPI001C270D95|nr:uncharacterized protein LOC121757974 [Salvia splendens]